VTLDDVDLSVHSSAAVDQPDGTGQEKGADCRYSSNLGGTRDEVEGDDVDGEEGDRHLLLPAVQHAPHRAIHTDHEPDISAKTERGAGASSTPPTPRPPLLNQTPRGSMRSLARRRTIRSGSSGDKARTERPC
jgi:hypothetical protein